MVRIGLNVVVFTRATHDITKGKLRRGVTSAEATQQP